MIPMFLMTDSQRARAVDYKRMMRDARMDSIKAEPLQPWDLAAKWKPRMHFDASTWSVPYLPFTAEEVAKRGVPRGGETVLVSPTEKWAYRLHTHAAYREMRVYFGRDTDGYAAFNDEIQFPVLFGGINCRPYVWMSYTPMEVITLRGGVRAAKGHTVVAGLGFGYQLHAICSKVRATGKKPVTRVTVVERDQELVDWMWPTIKANLPDDVPVELIVGDAYEVLPKLTADVAVVDIDASYGNNMFHRRCDNIDRVWVWGSAVV